MSNKKEAYFKFIFPDYKYLTESNEGIPFAGTVKTLCDECSTNVITYDQLKAETPKILQYDDNTGWGSNDKRSRIKHYIDQYLEIPKYFNIRDYWDNSRSQAGGITLLVSHSPEVYADSTHGYTKFTSTYDNKVVYCSVIVSSGNFFYNFNLPEEVLAKSDLRDNIVSSQFHSNWYFKNDSEKSNYWDYSAAIGKPINPVENREKRVFNQCYFLEGNVIALGKQYDSQTGEVVDADASIIERQTRVRNSLQCDTNDLIGLPYGYDPKGTLTGYSLIREDLKKDFVDLEVTRRIIYSYYNNWTDTVPTIEIPKPALSGFGYNTILAYDRPGYDDRPREYIDNPPMPIRYDLLRNALSNRDPYGDCETVLVMWVADRDPATVSDGDVASLRAITWEQYAVPISVRCCVKDDGSESYSSNRFLVLYPNKTDGSYKLHTRRNDVYRQDKFKDAVYLPGLIEYSKDYVLTYQNSSYANNSNIFDIQKYLFQTRDTEAVYARRSYFKWTNNGHQQAYYILVKNSNNTEYRVDAAQPICIIGNHQGLSDYNSQFMPSVHLPKSMYHDGEYSWGPFANEGSEYWSINDNRFIALFNIANPTENESYSISQVSGTLTLRQGLRAFLNTNTNLPSDKNWDNIYLSSLGVSWECNWCNADNLFYHNGSDDDVCFPLGFLDGFIQINGVTYGRNVTSGDGAGKIVVGFKNVYDYAFDDHHHFVYDSNTDTYSLAVDSNYEYTAYVMDYNQ